MEITWIGQAGLLIRVGGLTVLVDPYLSDSAEKANPKSYRRMPVEKAIFDITPDVIVLTHDHLDHTDMETLAHYLSEDSSVTVLASGNAWQRVRAAGGHRNNYVMFNRGTRWTQGDVVFQAVYAEHSDSCAIGVILSWEGKTYYMTGDTLYNERIFPELPEKIDYVFLPINGVGNNMNAVDAARFTRRIQAQWAVPLHWGMFDELDPEGFEYPNRIIPRPFCRIL